MSVPKEQWTPTNRIRKVRRAVSRAQAMGPVVLASEAVLQQMFRNPWDGAEEWRDVELVDE